MKKTIIEKGVPIPSKRARNPINTIKHLGICNLKIGESFFTKTNLPNREGIKIRARILADSKRLNLNWGLSMRIYPDGFRIWRVK